MKIVNKALSTVEIIYINYLFLLIFDNTTSYLIYTKNISQVKNINENIKD